MAFLDPTRNKKSLGNSTSTPLGALASFVGAWESVLEFNGISVSGDGTSAGVANGTLFLEFSHDGLTTVRTLTIPVADITSMQPRTLGVISSFFRVRYDNDTTVQDTFSIETIYHSTQTQLVSRLDQSLQGNEDVLNVRSINTGQNPDGEFINIQTTRGGAMGVSVEDADLGFPVIVTPGGSMKVGDQTHLVGEPFGGAAISTSKWQIVLVGSGTQDASGPGELTMDTGTTADSAVQINTINVARFIPAHYNTTHHAITIPDGASYEADNIRMWGAVDATDPDCNGIWFEINSGAWFLVHCINGVPTSIPQGSWIGAGALSFPTGSISANVYEIEYNAGSIIWRVNGNVIHRATLLLMPYANTIHFPVGMANMNINGNTTDVSLKVRAAAIFTIGKGFGAARPFFISGATGGTLIKTGPGKLDKVIFARSGSSGGNATVSLYDNTTAASGQIGQIEVGGDDTSEIVYDVTTNVGLFVVISGSGSLSTTITFD